MALVLLLGRTGCAVFASWLLSAYLPTVGFPAWAASAGWALCFFCLLDIACLARPTLHPEIVKWARAAGFLVVIADGAALSSMLFPRAAWLTASLNCTLLTWGCAYVAWALLRCTRTTAPAVLAAAAAVEAAVAQFGAQDPHVALAKNALALAYRDAGRKVRALELFEEAQAILTKAGTDAAALLATVLVNKASMLADAGKFSSAEQLYLRALAQKSKLFGDDNPRLVLTLCGLGALHYKWGNFSKAQGYLQRALVLAAADESVAGCTAADIAQDLDAVSNMMAEPA